MDFTSFYELPGPSAALLPIPMLHLQFYFQCLEDSHFKNAVKILITGTLRGEQEKTEARMDSDVGLLWQLVLPSKTSWRMKHTISLFVLASDTSKWWAG
jgi:hypothetical protein